MAEALLSVAVEAAISKVMAVVGEQINLTRGFKDELQELRTSLELVNAFLQDAGQQKRSNDPPVRLWLQGLAEIASRADDLLEEIGYEYLRRQVEVGRHRQKKVSNFFSAHNPILFRLKVAKRIKSINASFGKKNNEASQLGLQGRLLSEKAPGHAVASEVGESHAFIGVSQQVIGREADLSQVVDLLIRSSTSGRPLGTVSVVGMAGLGKTTLAKVAFDHGRLKSQFDPRMWVCVSETFDVKTILKQILECLMDENVASFESKQKILMKLQEKLADKKYLLVLDDVWNRDTTKWNDLLDCLSGITKKTESAILATTRDKNVAATMGSPPEYTHELAKLEDEECWSIIKATCGISSSSDVPLNNLENTGRDIAMKCKGLPLAAKVIGGTLCKEKTQEAWSSIQQSDLWDSLESNEGIVRVLRLSFDRLSSPCLKKCFAYCSIFPDDYCFSREDLIQLWMAAGFLHPIARHTSWHIGNQYFNDLVSNSLFQDIKRDFYGNIIECKMHDVVHSFAKSLAEATILTSDTSFTSRVHHTRHLNLIGKETELAPKLKLDYIPNLHTLFAKFDIFHHNEKKFTRLRILRFRGANIEVLPRSIGELKHLKYFDISQTRIKDIPESFTRLYNMQTLKFVNCLRLNKLPKQMSNLLNLSHLVFTKKELMPINIGKLTCLQTLPIFVVGSERGRGIEELGSLTELQGKLEISKLELVKGEEGARRAKLLEKKQIGELSLEWSLGRQNTEQDEGVLEGLQPNRNLKGLCIRNYMGLHLSSWLLSSVNNFQPLLGNLMKLSLKSCSNCAELPRLGHLPNLAYLELSRLDNVKTIDMDFFCNGNFPSLKLLHLNGMERLEELMEVEPATAFPSLEKLGIHDCPKLKSIPWTKGLPRLQGLSVSGCKELRYLGEGLSSFMQLRKLLIDGCHNLKSIPSPWGASYLEELSLSDCRELECAPIFKHQQCSSLQDLRIKGCPNVTSGLEQILGHLSCLKALNIDMIFSDEAEEFPLFFNSIHHLHKSLETLDLTASREQNIRSLPHQIQNFTALKTLFIGNLNGLDALPEWLEKLSSLQYLEIINCENLKNVQALAGMSQLKELCIFQHGDDVEEFPPYFNYIHKCLPKSIEELFLQGWRPCASLPSEIQHLSALKVLVLSRMGIEALPEWIGKLSSLEKLIIWFCENLMHLPSQQSMQCLSKLKYLLIDGCPKISLSGPEWFKISHIPVIEFNYEIIQEL